MQQISHARTLAVLGAFSAAALLWAGRGLAGAAAQAPGASGEQRPAFVIDRAPVRVLEDDNPSFTAIAMDGQRSEVFIGNNNKASSPSILVYPTEFKTTERVMEPRRRIYGDNARLGDICGLAVSPEHQEIYTVQGESREMKVFPIDGNGNISGSRSLTIDHGAAGIFLDAKHDELFVTTEHINKISVYRRTGEGDEKPLRIIQGPHSGLSDPHSIYVDSETNEIFVTNYGNWRETKTEEDIESNAADRVDSATLPLAPSTGRFEPPSITVYSRTAEGDAVPLRVIQGSRTQMNLPLGLTRDPASDEIVVANSGANSVLFFDRNANGDVAPVRVLKGPATSVQAPTDVLIDMQHNELWVTNWENHIVTVYPRTAQGNVAPLRFIRSASKNAPPATFGTPGAVAWDPVRKEILVPN